MRALSEESPDHILYGADANICVPGGTGLSVSSLNCGCSYGRGQQKRHVPFDYTMTPLWERFRWGALKRGPNRVASPEKSGAAYT